MKVNSKTKKIIAVIFLFVLLFSNFSSNISAMTSTYANDVPAPAGRANENSLLSAFTDILLPMFYPIFGAIEKLTQKIVYMLTGTYSFPWADKIIFNSLPFLDVNFMNPEPGSFFLSASGQETQIGKLIRSTYFTSLSICLGFFGIAVAINVIKMLIATLPSAKARYKELINATIMSLVMIFACHYVIAFVFYINEQLVQVAADMSEKILNPDTLESAQNNLFEAEDKDNERRLQNFFDKCNVTSWWSPVTIIKSIAKNAVNAIKKFIDWVNNLGQAIKDAWDKFWGNDSDDDEMTLSKKDKRESDYYGDVFPSKEAFIGYFDDEDKVGKHGKDIAAYLLKDYMYRDYMLSMVAGNDTNSFSNAGFWGIAQSVGNTVLWFTGIVDTGLQGLQNLFNSVCFVAHLPEMAAREGINADWNNAASINNLINELTAKENAQKDDKDIANYHIRVLYVKAYYRYVYEGDDKDELQAEASMIQNLGEYFKRNIYYTNVSAGDWSPKTFNAIMCILYCVFVVQSFMFLFSYIKRFFFVVVLAMLGPITIVYDYVKKSY